MKKKENRHKHKHMITNLKEIEEARKKYEKRLSALNKYGQDLNKEEKIENIYTLTLKAMEKTLGFEHASFLVKDGKLLRPAKYCGYEGPLDFKLPLDGEKGITVKAANLLKPIYVPDVKKSKAYVKGGVKGMRSELAVPVIAGNEVLAVLNVESKRFRAFNNNDKKLLEILASHAAIALSNLKRQEQLRELSNKMKNLMKSTTLIMNVKTSNQRLKAITETIREFGWRRVVISLRDENLEGTAVVTAGLKKEEIRLLMERKAPGKIWRERLGPRFKRFRIGEFYYLPWKNQWIRKHVHGVASDTPSSKADTYAGVPSKLPLREMIDWHPQDMLYAPLRTPAGRIVGILSMDDPINGSKPNTDTLAPLELFLHQAAMVIENARLIQSLKQARKQLEDYASHLEQRVLQRTRELKNSQQSLLKAQRLAVIGELAGMVGHDLRNPLTSINGAVYYLKKKLCSGLLTRKEKEMLKLIEKNITYSNKIINDLLDYSKEIQLDLVESNPSALLGETLSIMEIPKKVKILNYTKDTPTFQVDIGRMKRAIVNIISNSFDAMPKGGKLSFRSKQSNRTVKLIFSDTGVGISERKLKKIWAPFYTTKAKGMGFGLPICKRIVEAHGGFIKVKSILRKGTTVELAIPLNKKPTGGEKIWINPLDSSLLMTTKT